VTDSKGLKAEDITIVNVSSTNRPPQGQAGAAQTVTGQSLVTLDGSASSDPDDGIASYRWTRVSGPPVKLSDPRLPRPSFREQLESDRRMR
jgi:hypothetical protein